MLPCAALRNNVLSAPAGKPRSFYYGAFPLRFFTFGAFVRIVGKSMLHEKGTNMFGRKRNSTASSAGGQISGLNLATDDREVAGPTPSSDELAYEILDIAREQARQVESGQEVTIVLKESHVQSVHVMELISSLSSLAPDFGLYAKRTNNNSQTFIKVT